MDFHFVYRDFYFLYFSLGKNTKKSHYGVWSTIHRNPHWPN